MNHILDKLIPESVELRRRLHRIPEVAWEEKQTAKTLKQWLARRGVNCKPLCDTGLVAEISSGSRRTLAIRSDIDALPIQEETGLPFSSEHSGRMHACGHDAHMAIVAATAAALAQLKESFTGTVKFIFQPAEEKPPGGARELIAAGVMRKPKVDMIFGLHVNPAIPVGKIGIREGTLMAGVLDFDIEISGKGGHSGLPHLANDAVLCAADLVTGLHTIVSRNIDPCEPAVLSIGKIEGGAVRNVLPASCKLYGTARALDSTILKKLGKKITSMSKATAKAHQCRAEIRFHDSYPPLINSPEAVAYLTGAAESQLGKRSVQSMKNPIMGGEDFARYLEHAPGAMFHLGVRNRSIGATFGWHHPKFMIDENAIVVGIRTLVNATLDYLND